VLWPDIVAWARGTSDSELNSFLEARRSDQYPPWESFTVTLVEEVPL
jgi:hypothetical protein